MLLLYKNCVIFFLFHFKECICKDVVHCISYLCKNNKYRIAAILAYGSQFCNSNSDELETPIASKNFWDSLNYRAQDQGRLIGVDYVEGFTVERYLGVNSLGYLI